MARMATPPLLKRLNEETVLDTIRSGAPISRAEISRRAGISKPTVSLALQSLLDAGLVREAAAGPAGPTTAPSTSSRSPRPRSCSRHRPRRALPARRARRPHRHDARAAGRRARRRRRRPRARRDRRAARRARRDGGPSPRADRRDRRRRSRRRRAGRRRRPARDERRRASTAAATARISRTRLGERVTLENDVNLAALGERRLGVAHGVDDFMFLSVGTGLGAGLVLRGELQRGHNGAAGELDYVARRPRAGDRSLRGGAHRGRPFARARTARDDVLPAIRRTVRSSPLRATGTASRAVVAEEARRIALHIAPIAAVTDVGLVVLGGGIGANAELRRTCARCSPRLPYPPRVEISSLGDGAVLMGAVAVGLRSALDAVFLSRRGRGAASG